MSEGLSQGFRFHPAAEVELSEAVQWYEKRSRGLGRIVLAEVHRVIERLGLFPEAYSQIRPRVRQAALRRMPLSVIYSPTPGGIVILMILDPRRDPKIIAQKLDSRTPD